MKVKCIYGGYAGNNSYIVSNDGECLVIDPATFQVFEEVNAEGLKPVAVLLTHGHFDHIAGVQPFLDKGVPVYIHEGDKDKCTGLDMSEYLEYYQIKPFVPTNLIKEEGYLHFAGLDVWVMETPGHSKGGVCYIIDNVIFSGDTLFAGSYGVYHFSDGNLGILRHSIVEKLFKLSDDFTVYSGHGEVTTLDTERQGNMILWS